MIKHMQINSGDLRSEIKKKNICIGGNIKLKIYGTLECKSGKRMNKEKRVFFISENEAINNGFRPCGNCMKVEYKKWKNEFI